MRIHSRYLVNRAVRFDRDHVAASMTGITAGLMGFLSRSRNSFFMTLWRPCSRTLQTMRIHSRYLVNRAVRFDRDHVAASMTGITAGLMGFLSRY